jgi:hypothetical protein
MQFKGYESLPAKITEPQEILLHKFGDRLHGQRTSEPQRYTYYPHDADPVAMCVKDTFTGAVRIWR